MPEVTMRCDTHNLAPRFLEGADYCVGAMARFKEGCRLVPFMDITQDCDCGCHEQDKKYPDVQAGKGCYAEKCGGTGKVVVASLRMKECDKCDGTGKYTVKADYAGTTGPKLGDGDSLLRSVPCGCWGGYVPVAEVLGVEHHGGYDTDVAVVPLPKEAQ